jgi:hypothetical protein
LIGQTEGVLFADLDVNPKMARIWYLTNNNVSETYKPIVFILFKEMLMEQIGCYCLCSSFKCNKRSANITDGTYKAALAYKANDFALYVNGVQIGRTCGSSGTSQLVAH